MYRKSFLFRSEMRSEFARTPVGCSTPMTGGNFRLLNRLLTQIERVLEINALREVTRAAVEVARQSLVIGEA